MAASKSSVSSHAAEALITLFLAIVALAVLVPTCPPIFPSIEARGPKTQQYLDCKSNLMDLARALEMYANDNNGRYPVRLEHLVPKQFVSIPTCPGARRDTYSTGFESCSSPNGYTVKCAGENHRSEHNDTPKDDPRYGSARGLEVR